MLKSASVVGLLASLAVVVVAGPAMAAAACPNAGFTIVESRSSPKTRPVKDGDHHTLFVLRDQLTTTTDITDIKLQSDADGAQLLLSLTPDAASQLHQATTNHDGLQFAFVVGDQALSNVTWSGPFGMDAGEGVQLSLGRLLPPDARSLVAAIQKCVAAGGK